MYKNEYKTLELTSLFELYNSKYQLNKSELLLLLSKLTLIEKITFNKKNDDILQKLSSAKLILPLIVFLLKYN